MFSLIADLGYALILSKVGFFIWAFCLVGGVYLFLTEGLVSPGMVTYGFTALLLWIITFILSFKYGMSMKHTVYAAQLAHPFIFIFLPLGLFKGIRFSLAFLFG